MMPGMASLFDPFEVRGVTFRNRIGISPMCMYSATDGVPNDWHLQHLGSRAAGGAGLVIAEATAVEARGRISPYDTGIWNDQQAEAWQRIARFIAEQGAVPAIQLAHAGRKAGVARPWDGGRPLSDQEGGWPIVGASAIPFADGFRTPAELTIAEIQQLREAFRAAARRAVAAGFRAVEVHGAHGYLLHSFYSPLSNRRTDAYGGDFDGRTRLIREVTRDVRSVVGDAVALFVRLSCSDWTDGGWTIEHSVELARRLKQDGADLIDCSSGGNVPRARIAMGPGYQVPFAAAIRRGAEIATAAVGLIVEPRHADEIVREGKADLVLLARASLRDAYWPIHAAQELSVPLKAIVPQQYERGYL